MSYDNKFYFWVNFECFFQCYRIHIPSIIFCIDTYKLTTLVCHRINCGIKSHIRTEYFMSF